MPDAAAITRWIICGAAVALVLIEGRIAEQGDGPSAAGHAGRHTNGGVFADTALPGVAALRLERVMPRAHRHTGPDPFDARSWESPPAEEPGASSERPSPPAPQPPPLPFTFLGKLIDGEHAVVFLTTGERNWVVQAGDSIDGAYRVEAIGEEKMTLTHLVLGVSQALAIGERTPRVWARNTAPSAEALPALDTPPPGAVLPGQVRLLFAAPSRTAAGNELVVSVGLPAGNRARIARIGLAYDPRVLAAIDVPPHEAGHLTVELAESAKPLAQVRFKVTAQSPVVTRIGVESATATDSSGARIPLVMPGGQDVTIMHAGR